MKKIKQIFLVCWCLFFLTVPGFAANYKGKIIDLFGDNIATVEFSQDHGLRPGDKIDLTYMAGVLPMAIGVYEVTTVKDQVVIARPVSLNMPPNKGMKIQVDKLARGPVDPAIKNTKAATNVKPPAVEAMAGGGRSSSMEIKGEVLEVKGDAIRVAIKDNGTPGIGWAVDLFYVTDQGKDLPVGQWKVVSVDGQVVAAEKVNGVGNARKGLKALIHNRPERKAASVDVSSGPTGVGSVEDHMSEPGVFRDPSKSRSSSIELLGETPPQRPIAGKKGQQPDKGQGVLGSFFSKNSAPSKPRNPAKVTRYRLGVEIVKDAGDFQQAGGTPKPGVRIVNVFPGSAARKAGLKAGDIILEVNGQPIVDPRQLVNVIGSASSASAVIRIKRGGAVIYKTVQLDPV